MRVLIVDDIQTNLDLLSRIIARVADVTIKCCQSPFEALAWSTENAVDLVLVDYHMPSMTGTEFLQAFHTHDDNSDVPVIVITADTRREVRLEALGAGASDFLTKPVDSVEVRARVTNLLALRRAQLELRDRATWLAREVELATKEIVEREHELVRRLSRSAEYRDHETGQHIARIAEFSHAIARKLGLPKEECDLIRWAAPMHDVGKVGIPDMILLKPAALSEDEKEVMRQHTRFGAEILGGSNSRLIQLAASIAAGHHERYDGGGYPRGLRGEEIPLPARIVAVADVFDALTSQRPYKKAWPVQDAVDLLKQERGRHFDPACVDAFLACGDEIEAIMQDGRTH